MFDKYFTNRYPSQINVTEKRAPTDESVKLLSEFEQAAYKKFIRSVPLKNNVIEGEILVSNCGYGHEIDFVLVVRVNGQTIDIKFSGDSKLIAAHREQELINLATEHFSKELVKSLMSSAKYVRNKGELGK